MNRVKVNGRWYNEERDIKEEVCRVYQGLLADPGGWKPKIDALMFERLEEGDVEGLEKPFTEEEVFKALSGCYGEKAPDLDDFSMAFWQFSWEFVKEEVMNFFRQFHETGSFVRSLNATFLVLIPKKGGAEDLKDFRPISLVGGLYKWLAKIMDTMLVANEAIDSIVKSNRGVILCKLDIEKAYDHVDWDFLLAMMEKMGLGKDGAGLRANLEKSELIPVGRVENADELLMSSVTRCLEWLESDWRRFKGTFCGGGGALEQKPHLVRWSIVCLDKRSRGLGVKSLGAFNRALLGKWVWRFANERKALWNQVIRGKYGEERGGWRSCETREAYEVGLWKAISKMGHLVTPSFGFVVGDGEKVKFWKDKWCETIHLSEAFPSLFALASNKEAWVNEV
ncbi:putative ribonuclease H protein [Vitis vinifera]|uniref:Putative ribonuclease H protein n=1 Tax=Vitis vinifera TaxID=29760 RepID=A0A438J326_VITVI|nr:putative ribonuclease H protein [Vitis vinifera]